MIFLTTLTHRGFLMTVATSAIHLTLCGSLVADDKSPTQILGGKTAVTSNGSGRFYDGGGRYAARGSASTSTIRLYDSQGRFTGRLEGSKDSTRVYDRSGSFAGRSTLRDQHPDGGLRKSEPIALRTGETVRLRINFHDDDRKTAK